MPRSSSYNSSFSMNFGLKPIAAAYFVVWYFATMFLATFCNVAFYREIMNALNGRPVSILEGIRFAFSKWKIIFMWTLFAGLIGFIIKSLEERFGWFGELILKFIGTVWSVACSVCDTRHRHRTGDVQSNYCAEKIRADAPANLGRIADRLRGRESWRHSYDDCVGVLSCRWHRGRPSCCIRWRLGFSPSWAGCCC